MAYIIADTRERDGANLYFNPIIDENNRKYTKLAVKNGGGNIELKIKQIDIGDYCVIIKESNRTINAIMIERKTWKDLSASIKDGRMASQSYKLDYAKDKLGCMILYIIEGPVGYKDDTLVGNIPFKNLFAKIRHNLLRGHPYVQTRDAEQTAKIVVLLARDILKLYKTNQISFPKQVEKTKLVDNYYREISEITNRYKKLGLSQNVTEPFEKCMPEPKLNLNPEPNLALSSGSEPNISSSHLESNLNSSINPEEDILDGVIEYDEMIKKEKRKRVKGKDEIGIGIEKPPVRDSDIIANIWKSLPGISAVSAAVLVDSGIHVSELFEKERSNIIEKISELRFPSGTKIGETKARKIFGNNMKEEKQIQIDMISVIPGLSKEVAEIIIDNYNISDIVSGTVNPEDLSELKYNGRRIRLTACETLVEMFIKPKEKI